MYLRYSIEIPCMNFYRESGLEAARAALVKTGATVIADSSAYHNDFRMDLMGYARRMIQCLRANEEFAEGEDVIFGCLKIVILK